MKFGDWVRTARRFHDLTPIELATKAHISKSLIYKIELGTASPSLRSAERICRAMGFELWRALKIVAESK